MSDPNIIYRFILSSETSSSKLIKIEDFKDLQPFVDLFYIKDEYRILTNGKTQPFPNKETVVRFSTEFYDIDIEEACLKWIEYWNVYMKEIEYIKRNYDFQLDLYCELLLDNRYPPIIFPKHFIDFLTKYQVKFSIDLYSK